MASSVVAARPPKEVVMFRFWKEESEGAQELAAADYRLCGESDTPESDTARPRTPEADQVDLDRPPSVLADHDGESPSMLEGDGHEPAGPEPRIRTLL